MTLSPHRSSSRVLRAACGAGAALALILPATSFADAQWMGDSAYAEQSTPGIECATGLPPDSSTSSGGISTEYGVINRAMAYFDAAAPPQVGDIAYVSIEEYAPDGDGCALHDWGGTSVSFEVLAPSGTHVATDVPFLCGYGSHQPATQCAVTAQPSANGAVFLKDGRNGDSDWPLADIRSAFRIVVPLRVDAPIASFGATREKFCGGICPESDMPGRAQFAVRFQMGAGHPWTDPLQSSVGLMAVAASSGGGGGSASGGGGGGTQPNGGGTQTGGGLPSAGGGTTAGAVFAGLPTSSISRSALRHGLAFSVNSPGAAKISARLTKGSRTIARLSTVTAVDGVVPLRLRASASALKRLGRAKAVRAVLTVSVQAAGAAAASTQSRSVRITR